MAAVNEGSARQYLNAVCRVHPLPEDTSDDDVYEVANHLTRHGDGRFDAFPREEGEIYCSSCKMALQHEWVFTLMTAFPEHFRGSVTRHAFVYDLYEIM